MTHPSSERPSRDTEVRLKRSTERSWWSAGLAQSRMLIGVPDHSFTPSFPIQREGLGERDGLSRRSLTRVTSECAWMSLKKWGLEAG